MRWRRAVERELASIDLTFTQWLVLDAAQELIEETRDAINQNAIAARTELDKMTISQVVRRLEKQGLVSRGPAFGRPAIRLMLTAKGERLLAAARVRAEAASRRFEESALGHFS